MIGDDLTEDFVEADGDVPVGVVGFELGQVGDVADVVVNPVLADVLPVHFFAGHLLDLGDSFEHGDAVFAAAAEVVDFAGSEERRVGKECRTVCRSRWSPYH